MEVYHVTAYLGAAVMSAAEMRTYVFSAHQRKCQHVFNLLPKLICRAKTIAEVECNPFP